VSNYPSSRWSEITSSQITGFILGVAALAALIVTSEAGFVFIIDNANLLFHEAGHPLVGLFSQRLETYGGTIGQLTFPTALAISFWRRGDAVSFAASVIWFFENWLNIARYMADARMRILPLVGGGDHDWARIFGRWHVLNHDTQIAAAVKTMGWLGMGATCLWVVLVWWGGRVRRVARATGAA
jgi:hypothetical protein